MCVTQVLASQMLVSLLPLWCLLTHTYLYLGFMVAQMVKNLPVTQETHVQLLVREDPVEKGTATHSSIPAWSSPSSLIGFLDPWAGKNWTWLSVWQFYCFFTFIIFTFQ